MPRNVEVTLNRSVYYTRQVIVAIPDSVSEDETEEFILTEVDFEREISTDDMDEEYYDTEIYSIDNAEDSALVDIDLSDAEVDA